LGHLPERIYQVRQPSQAASQVTRALKLRMSPRSPRQQSLTGGTLLPTTFGLNIEGPASSGSRSDGCSCGRDRATKKYSCQAPKPRHLCASVSARCQIEGSDLKGHQDRHRRSKQISVSAACKLGYAAAVHTATKPGTARLLERVLQLLELAGLVVVAGHHLREQRLDDVAKHEQHLHRSTA